MKIFTKLVIHINHIIGTTVYCLYTYSLIHFIYMLISFVCIFFIYLTYKIKIYINIKKSVIKLSIYNLNTWYFVTATFYECKKIGRYWRMFDCGMLDRPHWSVYLYCDKAYKNAYINIRHKLCFVYLFSYSFKCQVSLQY